MNRILFPLMGSVVLLFAACENTADPSQGGLFGWSESKAKTRQVALHDALYLEENRVRIPEREMLSKIQMDQAKPRATPMPIRKKNSAPTGHSRPAGRTSAAPRDAAPYQVLHRGSRSQRAQLNRMLAQLDEVEARGGRVSGLRSRISNAKSDESLSEPELRVKVSSLESEVRSLRKEYGLTLERR